MTEYTRKFQKKIHCGLLFIIPIMTQWEFHMRASWLKNERQPNVSYTGIRSLLLFIWSDSFISWLYWEQQVFFFKCDFQCARAIKLDWVAIFGKLLEMKHKNGFSNHAAQIYVYGQSDRPGGQSNSRV